MWKLIPIVVFALFMAFLSDNNSAYEIDEYGCKEYIYKEKFFYFIMACSMAIFVGLRTSGNDTSTYRALYERINVGTVGLQTIEWTNLSSAPGLDLLQVIIKTMGATTQDYLMITGFFVTYTYLWFIKKYTSEIWLSVYYFITMGVYTFSMAAIKQTMAVAFLMFATDNAIRGKWARFVFWLIIAELFHPYAFIYAVVPFLTFAPWSKRSYWLLAGTAVVALFLSRLMGSIDNVTTALGYTNYSVNEFTGAGVNIFRVLVVWVTVILSFMGRNELRESTDRIQNIMVNLTMMNAVIMFIGLFGTANYFARLANYFLIFQVIALPWLFRFINFNSRKLVEGLSVIAYFIYFYYDHVLTNGRFDWGYNFITIFDYLMRRF